MNFSKSVVFLCLLGSYALFGIEKSWVTGLMLAFCLLTFVSTEIFSAYEKMAKSFSAKLREAASRAETNEAAIKALVEAGLRMEAKINEMESKQTLDGVGRFAGLKR